MEIPIPALLKKVSPASLGDFEAGGFLFFFRCRPADLRSCLVGPGVALDAEVNRELKTSRIISFELAEFPFLLATAEGFERAVLGVLETKENVGAVFMLQRSGDTWDFQPVDSGAKQFKDSVCKEVRSAGLPVQTRELDETGVPRRMEAVARRFKGDGLIRDERERKLREVGGQFIEPAVLVNGSTKNGGLKALDDWLGSASVEPALVLGEFGSGKSTLLLEWAMRQNEAVAALSPLKPPLRLVFCNLAGAGGGANGLGLVLAACELEDTPANRAGAELLIRYGGLVPCFDGFDEMATRVSPGELAGRLSELLSVARGGGRVLVSSRDNYFPSDEALRTAVSEALNRALGGALAYRRIRLQPFDDGRIKRLVQAICGSAPAADEALSRISSIYELSDLVHKPLLLGMVVKSLDSIDSAARIAHADVYEAYLMRWLENTHCPGPESEVFTDEQKETFAESLAEQLWRSGEPSLSWIALRKSARRGLLPDLPEGSTASDAFYEISGGAFFVRDQGTDRYRFAHKSFLEFFLARSLVRTLPEHPAEVLATQPFGPEVAMFAGEILRRKGDPKEAPAIRSVQEWLRSGRLETALDATAGAAANALRLLKGLARWADDGWDWIPEQADLRRIEMPGEDLKGIRLHRARFSGALLSGSDLSDSDLSGADLTNTRLVSARLDRANLAGATAARADFTRVEATGCVLDGADLRGADLTASVWLESSWDGTRLDGAITSGLVAPLVGSEAGPQLDLLSPTVQIGVELGHSGSVECVAFSPDGRRIASGAWDHTVRLWDTKTGEHVCSLIGHSASVLSVVFVPDRNLIVSGSRDNTIRIWSVRTCRELTRIHVHPWLASAPAGAVDLLPAQASRLRLEATFKAKDGSRTTLFLPLPKPLLEVFHRPDLVARSLAGEDISPDEFRPALEKLGIKGGRPWDGQVWRVPESPKDAGGIGAPPATPQATGSDTARPETPVIETPVLSNLPNQRRSAVVSPSVIDGVSRDMTERTLFSWIHLSDIHFGHPKASHQWDRVLVLDELKKDVQGRAERGIPQPNAILVTGDIAFSGLPNQYKEARTWLHEIASVAGVPESKILVVPGNHDVDRTVDKEDKNAGRLIGNLRENRDDLDAALQLEADKKLLVSRMREYLSFVAQYPATKSPDPLFWSHQISSALSG